MQCSVDSLSIDMQVGFIGVDQVEVSFLRVDPKNRLSKEIKVLNVDGGWKH
jgi:hypothetical protein